MMRFLPLVSLPKLNTPEISAKIAGSFGLRASNKSATRGRPPVISLLPDDACGIRARMSPTSTLSPLLRLTNACAGSKYCAGACEPGNRSEEHTSELQSRPHLVCSLLLEKKN